MNGTIVKKLLCAGAIALAALAPLAQAEEKKTFNLAWTIYVGWMPWKYADESGIMKKWADRYGVEVNITQINDYIESINQYSAGQFDAVVATSMDALSIPAAGGVDSTAVIVGSYSNGNDGLVMKDSDDLRTIKGQTVHLVELSVSHYLLAKALDSVGLSERDVKVVNTSDADLVAAFGTDEVRNIATWSPLLQEVTAAPGARLVFDSTRVPGHIKDLLIANSETLADNPAFGKALVGAWYEVMAILASDTPEGRALRAELGAASGTDQAGYEAQLATTRMFYEPADAVAFIGSAQAREALDSVRQFSFEHGLLGDSADSVDFVGIALPDGSLLGSPDNVKLRFDARYMQQAAEGAL